MNKVVIAVISVVGVFAVACSSVSTTVSPFISPISPLTTPSIAEQRIKPLNLTSPDSILEWIEHGLNTADMQVFDLSARDSVGYGLCESEGIGAFTNKQFLDEVRLRLSSQPKCSVYTYHSGEINTLWVLTSGWSPTWDFGGGNNSGYLMFEFSDQWTQGDGLYLAGVCITTMPPPFPDGKPCP